jgi:phosphohistidine swiveling domain-containing protein
MSIMSDSNRNYTYYSFDSAASKTATLSEVGGKALSLIESTQAGFPVPGGFVLTVSFFKPWLQSIKSTSEWKTFVQDPTKQACDAVKARCATLTLDASQEKNVNEAWKEAFESDQGSNKLLVAVRSSSPEEDLAGTSFAGGYETTLGVTQTTLANALIASFESAFDYRIVQYKNKIGMAVDEPKIAVVVQRQIASDVSGVAFSLNPSNNCYDEVVISANFGLGESVVGGIVTPDTYTVDIVKEEIISKQVADKEFAIWLQEDTGGTRQEDNKDPSAQALSDEQILEVAAMVSNVESYREGTPVDIEWAFQNNELFLLQSRPVTAFIPLFPEMITERGEEKNLYLDAIVMTQGFSEPMSVLGLDIWFRMFEKAKPHMTFLNGKHGLVWNINGREYIHISNMLKCPSGRVMVEKAFAMSDKSLGRAIDSIELDEYTPSHPLPGAWKFIWFTLRQLFQMLPNMLFGMFWGKKALLNYQEYSQELFDDCLNDEYLKNCPFDDTVKVLMNRFEGLVPRLGFLINFFISRGRVHKLFRGNEEADKMLISLCMDLDGNPTSEMGHMMVNLASRPEIQETKTSGEFLTRLDTKTYSDEFMTAYDEYIRKFGCRGMKEIDVATPRTYEKQNELFDQLKQIDIEHNAIKTVMERRQEAYDKLLELAVEMNKGDKFRYHANVIQTMGGYREHPKYIYVAINAMLRRRALQLGERFVQQGRLKRVDQVFDLNVEELTAAEADDSMKLLPLVEKNLEAYKSVESVKDWPVLIDSRGKIIRAPRRQEDAEEGCLLGDAISPGVVSGRAKVLNEPYEKPLERGEILIAKCTEPSWTPIFINCAAVVMEVGGVMQHGAIIAREYGIPCVSGIDKATKIIKDGALLQVNGSDGEVRIVEEE